MGIIALMEEKNPRRDMPHPEKKPKYPGALELKNLSAVLAHGGMTMADVVKTTVFLQSMEDFAKVNAIYAEAFGANKPARSCVEVAKLPKGGLVEVEAIAVKE